MTTAEFAGNGAEIAVAGHRVDELEVPRSGLPDHQPARVRGDDTDQCIASLLLKDCRDVLNRYQQQADTEQTEQAEIPVAPEQFWRRKQTTDYGKDDQNNQQRDCNFQRS